MSVNPPVLDSESRPDTEVRETTMALTVVGRPVTAWLFSPASEIYGFQP